MNVGEQVHWYLTDKCNLKCSYCFKPHFEFKENDARNETLAGILAESDVKKIILGGGEPTVVKNLMKILQILKAGKKHISIHTNGILLDAEKIKELEGLVDDIALPIDSVDKKIQEQLRGRKFIKVVNKLPKLASEIKQYNMTLGYHTIFTAINQREISAIYRFISQQNFDYWRIYEFNEDLARCPFLNNNSRYSPQQIKRKLNVIELLGGIGTLEKGYTDCLYAHFLLMEQKMSREKDKRIKFVGVRDAPIPYAFLDNQGNISFYSRFSWQERRIIGNILTDKFQNIKIKLKKIHENPLGCDDKTAQEYIDAEVSCGDLPIWARLHEGVYFPEEVEDIQPRYLTKVSALSKLYEKRRAGLVTVL